MQYMVKGTPKTGSTAEEVLRLSNKFSTSWTPPAGFSLEGNWGCAGGVIFALVSADPYSALVEGMAQFSTIVDWEVYPVVSIEEFLPAQSAGLNWALAD